MFSFAQLRHFEIPLVISVLVRRDNSRRDRLLFIKAQTRRKTRFQHAALAKISCGNAGERAIPKIASQLAFDFAITPVALCDLCAQSSLLPWQREKQSAPCRDP